MFKALGSLFAALLQLAVGLAALVLAVVGLVAVGGILAVAVVVGLGIAFVVGFVWAIIVTVL